MITGFYRTALQEEQMLLLAASNGMPFLFVDAVMAKVMFHCSTASPAHAHGQNTEEEEVMLPAVSRKHYGV